LRTSPIRDVVTASPELELKFAVAGPPEGPVRERTRGVAGLKLRPAEASPLCPCDHAQLCGGHHTRKRCSVSAGFLFSVEQMSSVKAPAQKLQRIPYGVLKTESRHLERISVWDGVLQKCTKSEQAAAEHATHFEPPISNIWKQQRKNRAPARNCSVFDSRERAEGGRVYTKHKCPSRKRDSFGNHCQEANCYLLAVVV
jgi:hypothetical protein